MNVVRLLLGWAITVAIAVALGSMVQTQFNLEALNDLGVPVGLGDRLSATLHDLRFFTQAYVLLISIAFAIAWPVAALFRRWLPGHRTLLFTLAGAAAVRVMLAVMDQALPVTAIAAARGLGGTIALTLTGAVAGWIYTRMIPGVENATRHS